MSKYGIYIWASYGFTALVFGGLIWRSFADLKAQLYLTDKRAEDKERE